MMDVPCLVVSLAIYTVAFDIVSQLSGVHPSPEKLRNVTKCSQVIGWHARPNDDHWVMDQL